ncbi:MAG: polyprenyl synthetase family protein [Candidatus Aminicenantes bacterium]|nr:polyprenyl synthetase family protein [Candidatus Aminicenantes bacterium]
MEPEVYLKQKKARLEKALQQYLFASDTPVFEAMRYAVLSGGKRFRPLLLLSCGEYFGGQEEVLLPYACAIEFIHNYSLIHDDLPAMDNDDFRRGQPTCHRKFGEALALLAGDALLTLAFQVLAEAPVPRENPVLKDLFIKELAAAAGPAGMIEGQWLDISFRPEDKKQENYQKIALKKTAGLIMAAAVGGARLAGAEAFELEAVKKYSYNLGLAFQLWDDLEDLGLNDNAAGSARPNLASFLGKQKSLEKLFELQTAAVDALRSCGIQCPVLEYFVWFLQPKTGVLS